MNKILAAVLLGSIALSLSACSGGHPAALPSTPQAGGAPFAEAVGRHTKSLGQIAGVMTFNPPKIAPGGVANLTIFLADQTNAAITNMSFTDSLPQAPYSMKIAKPTATVNTCGGTLTAPIGATTFSLSGGSIPVNQTCQITLQVTGATPGTDTNVIAEKTINSDQGSNGSDISAKLQVSSPPLLAQNHMYIAMSVNPNDPTFPNDRVYVFPSGAGNQKPDYTIVDNSSNAYLQTPFAVTVDPFDGEIYVANTDFTKTWISVYPQSIFNGVPLHSTISPTPSRTIYPTELSSSAADLHKMAIDGVGRLVLVIEGLNNPSLSGAYWYPVGANQTVSSISKLTTGTTAPWTSIGMDLNGGRVFLEDNADHFVNGYDASGLPPNGNAPAICHWAPAPFGHADPFDMTWNGKNNLLYLIVGRVAAGGEIYSLDPCANPNPLTGNSNPVPVSDIFGPYTTTLLTDQHDIAANQTTGDISVFEYAYEYNPTPDYKPYFLTWAGGLQYNGAIGPNPVLGGTLTGMKKPDSPGNERSYGP